MIIIIIIIIKYAIHIPISPFHFVLCDINSSMCSHNSSRKSIVLDLASMFFLQSYPVILSVFDGKTSLKSWYGKTQETLKTYNTNSDF